GVPRVDEGRGGGVTGHKGRAPGEHPAAVLGGVAADGAVGQRERAHLGTDERGWAVEQAAAGEVRGVAADGAVGQRGGGKVRHAAAGADTVAVDPEAGVVATDGAVGQRGRSSWVSQAPGGYPAAE